MPWKIGGNFEIVTTKCEAGWRECAIAIVSYLWCEMVSDVVDCLGKHGMIWVLIVTIASTILLRIKHRRNMRTRNGVLGKQMFNKVGYKIHDLELKINILTYKMQYGTWPLPHQIYNLDSKKRKIKMTLSNPGDHKSWINRVLLSPMKNSMCVPYPNMFGPSEVKLQGTDYSPDIKEKHTVRHVECNESPVHSSQETLHEVKKRLQILHNALKMYQNTSQSSQEESKRDERKEGETDASVTETECKPDCNVDSQGNSREPQHSTNKNCAYLVHSVDSLSSLIEYSSNTSRTYRCPSSDIAAARNPCCQDSSQYRIVREPVETSDLPATSPCDEQSSHLYSLSTLRASEDCANCENKYVKDAWRCDHIVKSDVEISENIMDADGSFEPDQKTSETISEGTCCILSPGPFEDENMSSRNGISSSKFVETLDKETQKNAIASESSERVSNDSDREERPTALLLQEALHFKKILLTRIDSAKEQLTRQDADFPGKYKEMNNFPSMILDIKRKEQPIINGSCDQMSQDYVYLEMKQRRDSFLRSEKPSILAQRDSKEESQDRFCKTSSKYFSITNLATENDNDMKIDSDVLLSSLKPPIYEKVVSIMIPVETTSREIKAENHIKESSIERNLSESLRENPRGVDDDDIAGFSPTVRKLEDLVMERIRSIRDYMDTFLRNQNEAISKVRRALQYQDGSDATLALRCSNEASHVMLHKRLIAIHNRDKCIDKAVSFSNDSPDLLLKAWPNHHEVLLENDVLKYCSNVCLRRNPEMFALVAPRAIKSEFSDNHNPPETTVELAKQETVDPSISMTFERSYEKDAAKSPARKMTEDELYPRKRTMSSPDRTSKRKVVADTLSADLQKRERQRQDAESKSLAISSHYSPNVAETNPIIGSKIVEIVKSHEKLPATSNDNSTSNSSSYFTNATASSMKMDDACSKSIFILEQSCAESILEQETGHSQTISRENNSEIAIEGSPSVKISQLSSNLEYSSLKTLVNSNLIAGKSECDCSTKTMLNGNDLIPHDSAMSFSSLNMKEKTLKINDDSSSNMLQGNEILIADPTEQLLQTHPRIKAKSDVSLDEKRRRILNANLHPKRSLSLLTRHDSLAHVQRTLHQSHINNIHLQYDNKDKFANRSMSVVPSQRVSTRSCIPISKNRLEHVHRARHQALAKSPTRGPLTVSCREKTLDKSHAENVEIAQRHGIPINRHLHEEVPLDLIELEKDVFAKESKGTDKAKATRRDNNATSRDVKSPTIDKEHPRETKRTHDGKSDTKITERENATRRTVAVISIVADEDVRRNYSGNSFILKTENVCSASDFLRHKNKLWTITIERTERETATKPSITDTCTSMSEIALKTN